LSRLSTEALVTACYNGEFVLECILSFLAAVRVFLRSRSDTALEILALRQQVAVLKRKRPRPPLNRVDRLFWVALQRLWSRWTDVLVIVNSERTVARQLPTQRSATPFCQGACTLVRFGIRPVAFRKAITSAKLRNAHLRLLTLLCSLQSGAGVRSATLNRCTPPIGKTGRWRSGRHSLFSPAVFSLICGGLAWSATRTANIRSAGRRRLTRSSGPDEVLATHRPLRLLFDVMWRGCAINFRPPRIPSFLRTGGSRLAPSFSPVIRVYL
jgi:hypothetical protein